MIRQTLEEQIKREFEKKRNTVVSSTVEKLKSQYDDKLEAANGEVLELKDQLEHAEGMTEELQLKAERLDELELRLAEADLACARLEQINKDTQAQLEITQRALRSEHDQKVRQLAQQNEVLQNEILRLRQETSLKERDIAQSHETGSKYRERAEALELDLHAKARALQSYSEMVDSLRSESHLSLKRTTELEAALSDVSSKLRDKEEQISSLQEREAAVEDLRLERDQLTDQIEDLVNEAKLRQDELKTANARIAAIGSSKEEECALLRKELDLERARSDEASSNFLQAVKQLNAMSDEMEHDREARTSEIQSLAAELERTRQAAGSLEAKNSLLFESVVSLQTQVAAASSNSEEVVALRQGFSDMQRDVEARLLAVREEYAETLSQKDLKIDQLQLTLTAAKAKTQRLEDDLETSFRNAQRLQKENQETESKFQLFEEDREQLYARIADLENASTGMAELDRMRVDLADSLRSQKQYLDDMRTARSAEERARRDCDAAVRELKRVETERDDVLRKASGHAALIESLNKQLDQLISHNNPNQKIQHHVKIKEENNSLKQQVTSLSIDLRKKQENLQRLNQKVEELNLRLTGQKDVPIDYDEEARLRAIIGQKDHEASALRKLQADTSEQLQNICSTIVELSRAWLPVTVLSSLDAHQLMEQLSAALQEREAEVRSLRFSAEMEERERDVARKVSAFHGGTKEHLILKESNQPVHNL